MTTLDHSGVKGMKHYEHKFGKWQPQAKYANGQSDPEVNKKSKDIEDIGKTLSKDELSKITRDKTYKLSKNSVYSDVAYAGGKPASFLELYKDEGYEKGQVSINVATAPEFRGKGLSKKLVKKVLDNPPEGVTEIYWETDTDNKASSAVAKSLGFEKAKDYGEGDDNYVYKVKKEDDEDTSNRLMEEARAKKMKHSDIHKDLVHSVLMARFEEEIYHSDSFEHFGVKGMKHYEHKFGRWQRKSKYANGQPDPHAEKKKKAVPYDEAKSRADKIVDRVRNSKLANNTINGIRTLRDTAQKNVNARAESLKEGARQARELNDERKRLRKLHRANLENLTMDELKELNERSKLLKQYRKNFEEAYPDEVSKKEGRRELVKQAVGLAVQEGVPKVAQTLYDNTKAQREKRAIERLNLATLDKRTKLEEAKAKATKEQVNLQKEKNNAGNAEVNAKIKLASAQVDDVKRKVTMNVLSHRLNRANATVAELEGKKKLSFREKQKLKAAKKEVADTEKAILESNKVTNQEPKKKTDNAQSGSSGGGKKETKLRPTQSAIVSTAEARREQTSKIIESLVSRETLDRRTLDAITKEMERSQKEQDKLMKRVYKAQY